MHPLPTNIVDFHAPVEFVDEVEDLYFRSVLLQKNDFVTQHVHPYSHATYCGSGAARLWVDGIWERDVVAGQAVGIKAGKKHAFLALEDDTRITCVHDTTSAGYIKEKGL